MPTLSPLSICAIRPESKPSNLIPAMLTPPPPYKLLPMRLEDIDAVLEIDRLAFPTPAKSSLFHYELSQNKIAYYQILTAGKIDEIPALIGFGGYWMIADEIHISTIAVSPSWRGRGLGELLLLNMLFMGNEQAAQLATLEVRQGNKVAQALYDKYDFEIVGRRPRYYRDTGEDALLMTTGPFDARYYHTLERRRDALYTRLKSEA